MPDSPQGKQTQSANSQPKVGQATGGQSTTPNQPPVYPQWKLPADWCGTMRQVQQ